MRPQLQRLRGLGAMDCEGQCWSLLSQALTEIETIVGECQKLLK